MKHLLLTSTLLFAGLSAGAAYRDVVLADQPVGYWRLGEPADSTTATNAGSLGETANGTLINGVFPGGEGALVGDPDTSVNLDGAQSKVEVPFAPELNTPVFTIEAWARVYSGSEGFYRSPLASRDDGPQKGFIFYADPSNNWQFWTGTGAQVGWNVVGGAVAEPDTWAHLVGTFDGTNKIFYVNGILVGANQSVFTPNGARVLRIGASATESPVGDFFFVGDLDEVAVYDKVLEPERVLVHFREGSGADPSADVPPAFAIQPASRDRFRDESVTFTAIATGSLPLAFQWKKDDANVEGATNATLTLSSLQTTDAGTYTVEVSNAAGSLVSDPAVLTVGDLSAPVITQQPRARTVLPGTTASFTVEATGSTSFDYQWQLEETVIAGATNATLTVTNVQTANLGSYRVRVTNPAGSVLSDPAILQFAPPATLSYSETVRQDDPVAYWRLGESSGEVADDEIGANDGAYLNGVTLGRPGAVLGDANTAAGFTTANQTKVDVPWSDVLNPAAFTFECWARVTGGSGAYRSPVTSRADFPQRGYIFYATPTDVWQFWIGSGDAGWTTVSGPAVRPDTYTHLVGVYDGTNMLFYVDGVLAAQTTAALAPNDANPLRIGGGATEGEGDFFFEGDVDEVAVYDTALPEERVLAHYVAGFPSTTPPSIVTQPVSQAALPGGTVSFNVSAIGGLPLAYNWFFNDQPLSSAFGTSLTISNVTAANVGNYVAVVSNAGGSVTSTVATLTIPTPPTQAYADLVRADGPVAYWRLGEAAGSEIADDEIGSNDGTYLEGVTLGVPGAIDEDPNTAASFEAAVSQKVDVPWSDVLNPPTFTAEVWARVTGTTGDYRSPLTSRADGPQRGYIFYAEPGNTWQFWSGEGDTSGWDNIPGPAIQTNAWTHLVATYDGTTKRFYVNGLLVGTSTEPFAVNDQSPLRIGGGASEGPGNYFFHGDVDEVAIYDEALSHEAIILHYLAGAPNVEAPVLTATRSGNDLVLTWTAGTLEAAATITGEWTTVAGATSPWTVTPADQARFFRLRGE
jgi:hypothetical protein